MFALAQEIVDSDRVLVLWVMVILGADLEAHTVLAHETVKRVSDNSNRDRGRYKDGEESGNEEEGKTGMKIGLAFRKQALACNH